jgi:hypothetical protein
MNTAAIVFLFAGSALVLAGGESTPIEPNFTATAEEAVTARSPAPAPRPRPTSAATKARLSAGLPGFTPSTKAGAEADAANHNERDADVPRNAIIRLPQYDVREDQLPKFRERELLTPKGREDVALRRHPGLRFGPLSFLNVRRGLDMLEEEDEIDRRREMAELLSFRATIERTLPQDPATGVRTIRAPAAVK